LCMEGTKITDLRPLRKLFALRIVIARHCHHLEDVTPLRHVWKIFLTECYNVRSIEPLIQQGARVWYLDVKGCELLVLDDIARAATIIPELHYFS